MKPGAPDRHQRRSLRLPGYDYGRPGAYYVTLCVSGRACLLGSVVAGNAQLSPAGQLVHQAWFAAAAVRDNVTLEPDELVVMPNHIHGIIHLRGSDAARRGDLATDRPRAPAAGSVGVILGQLKSVTTKAIRATLHAPNLMVWQRGYYEHVVRDEADLRRIQRYIAENPARWTEDPEHPDSATRSRP